MEDESRLVQITTTFEVHPDELQDQMWEARIRAAQSQLGALAGATSEVRVNLSIKKVSEIPVTPDEYGLDQDFTQLLLATANTTPQSAKGVGSKLKRHGLSTPRHILAVGTEGLGYIDDFAIKSRAYTLDAMQYVGLQIPEAPTPEETAVFCDSLDQVPGLVVMLQEIPRPKDPRSVSFLVGWKYGDVFKHTIKDIVEKPIDEVVSWIAASGYYNRSGAEEGSLDRKKAMESAEALRRVASRYCFRFLAAKQTA